MQRVLLEQIVFIVLASNALVSIILFFWEPRKYFVSLIAVSGPGSAKTQAPAN
jgi:hypothetical protein